MSTQVTINDVIPKTQITAAANQFVFTTNWTANAASDVVVYARTSSQQPDDLTQEINSANYTVAFVGAQEIVEVTFIVPRNAGDVITITRNTPADRLNLYTNTNFTPSMLNQDVGILTLVDQQAQLYNWQVAPHYNVSSTPNLGDSFTGLGGDIYLPILGANQFWVKNAQDSAIIATDLPTGGGQLPVTLPIVTYTSTPYLTADANLGALSSGILEQFVAGGVATFNTKTTTGTGSVVLENSPTLTTPKVGLTEIATNASVARTATFQDASGTVAYLSDVIPVGSMIDFAGTAAPTGYLVCDGTEVDQVTYAALYAVIGNTWGVAVDPTKFVLPNFQRRVAVGSGGVATPTLSNTVGSTGGAEEVQLTPGQMPKHDHNGSYAQIGTGTGMVSGGGAAYAQYNNNNVTLNMVVNGNDEAHPNMQPSAVVLKCIKF